MVGQGAHARAETRSEDHGFGGLDQHVPDSRAVSGADHITQLRKSAILAAALAIRDDGSTTIGQAAAVICRVDLLFCPRLKRGAVKALFAGTIEPGQNDSGFGRPREIIVIMANNG
jgi:hypothetical protein